MSIRYLWPFARLLGADPRALPLLAELGLTAADLAERDARVPCALAMRGIRRAVDLFQDPVLGLRAGAMLDEGVLDVLERAACSTENLGAATQVLARYSHIMNEALILSVTVEDSLAYIGFTWTIPHPPAANDIAISAALHFSQRVCEVYQAPVEIRLAHDKPSYASAYEQYFQAPVNFGATTNVIVMHASRMQAPMRRRSPPLARAFERKAQAMEQSRAQVTDLGVRVREALLIQFAIGSVKMADTAKRLGMGVATLRRKLEHEGESFAAILDEVRRDAANRYLGGREPTVSEVAFLLGFSDVRSFARAFRRWNGVSPTEFRQSRQKD